jgi:hypothetical protein
VGKISSNGTVVLYLAGDVVASSQSAGLCRVGSRRLIMSRETITTDSLYRDYQRRQRDFGSEYIRICEDGCGQLVEGLLCQCCERHSKHEPICSCALTFTT